MIIRHQNKLVSQMIRTAHITHDLLGNNQVLEIKVLCQAQINLTNSGALCCLSKHLSLGKINEQAKFTEDEIFKVEALGSAVLVTACTRTVCGEKWLDNYVSGLQQNELAKLQTKDSATAF